MLDPLKLIASGFKKRFTPHVVANLSDQSLLSEAMSSRTTFGMCPDRLLDEVIRRRDQAAAMAKEYRTRSDVERTSVVLDQFLSRTVRQPEAIRARAIQGLTNGQGFVIRPSEMMPHTTAEDVEAVTSLAKNVLSAQEMSARAERAAQRAKKLSSILRILSVPTSMGVQSFARPVVSSPVWKPRPRRHARRAANRSWSRT
jgi:hypothetical protein